MAEQLELLNPRGKPALPGSGRKPVTIDIVRRETIFERGRFGLPYLSRILVRRGAREKVLTLFEKHYPSAGKGFALANMKAYLVLKGLGMNVPTTYRFVELADGGASILQTDLTFGRKNMVTPTNDPNLRVIRKIKNWDEVVQRMKEDLEKAAEHGIIFNFDEWMISVDRKTGMASVHLTDFDRTVTHGKSDLASDLAELDKWRAKMDRVRKLPFTPH